jgi:1-acyl-sn-glycerol-3-phosphate acyltransferase
MVKTKTASSGSVAAWMRSIAFALVQILITPPYALIAIFTFPFSARTRYRVISGWARFLVWLAAVVCGVRYRIKGREHFPAKACVVLSKHQSTWETLAFQAILPPHVMVVKRELLWIPFFGWGLAMLSPIAIDRGAGMRALKQILHQGKQRLAAGFCVVMYPEGTRVAPGRHRKYQVGGAWLAVRAGVPVIPIAHNAGYLWPRNSFVKRPGTITVSVGAPVVTTDRRPDEVIAEIERWIEAETKLLLHP